MPAAHVVRESCDGVRAECRLDGWCADAAITVPVGETTSARLELLKATETVLAVQQSVVGTQHNHGVVRHSALLEGLADAAHSSAVDRKKSVIV